ncbi:uncharacterized protein [Amphiura filiformis]|uniref:uncharacterized protein n=1 Tax=Amphiura filiformis TaxID=82378 RepID=UPI003B20CD1B
MTVRECDSSKAHSRNNLPGIPSGPHALPGSNALRTSKMSVEENKIEHNLFVSLLLSDTHAMSKESLFLNTLWKYFLKRLACSAGMLVVELLYEFSTELMELLETDRKDPEEPGSLHVDTDKLSEDVESKKESVSGCGFHLGDGGYGFDEVELPICCTNALIILVYLSTQTIQPHSQVKYELNKPSKVHIQFASSGESQNSQLRYNYLEYFTKSGKITLRIRPLGRKSAELYQDGEGRRDTCGHPDEEGDLREEEERKKERRQERLRKEQELAERREEERKQERLRREQELEERRKEARRQERLRKEQELAERREEERKQERLRREQELEERRKEARRQERLRREQELEERRKEARRQERLRREQKLEERRKEARRQERLRREQELEERRKEARRQERLRREQKLEERRKEEHRQERLKRKRELEREIQLERNEKKRRMMEIENKLERHIQVDVPARKQQILLQEEIKYPTSSIIYDEETSAGESYDKTIASQPAYKEFEESKSLQNYTISDRSGYLVNFILADYCHANNISPSFHEEVLSITAYNEVRLTERLVILDALSESVHNFTMFDEVEELEDSIGVHNLDARFDLFLRLLIVTTNTDVEVATKILVHCVNLLPSRYRRPPCELTAKEKDHLSLLISNQIWSPMSALKLLSLTDIGDRADMLRKALIYHIEDTTLLQETHFSCPAPVHQVCLSSPTCTAEDVEKLINLVQTKERKKEKER